MASSKTLGEILTELVEGLRASFGEQWDRPADEDNIQYAVTFDAKLNDDALPWIGTDHSG